MLDAGTGIRQAGTETRRCMMRYLSVVLLAATGCYAIARGNKDEVRFFSDPPGAEVAFGEITGVTPCAFMAPKSMSPRQVTFSMAGREAVIADITPAREARLGPEAPLLLLDGFLLVGLFEIMGPIVYGWPYELHAKLPPEGQGSALMHVQRDKPGDWETPVEEIGREFGKAPKPKPPLHKRHDRGDGTWENYD
jgi:hypothetical protein